MMKMILKILKDIGINEVILSDQSKYKCKSRITNNNLFFNRKISMIFNEIIPYGMLSLLKNGKTFYMKFGFIPYYNNVNIIDKINELYYNINTISWNEINDIIIKGIISINKSNENNILYKQKQKIYDIELWKRYWIIVKKSFDELYQIYGDKCNGPFNAFKYYNDNNCRIFINWIELYSFSCRLFENYLYTFYDKNGKINNNVKIPFKKDFLNLVEIFRDIIWKIDNLQLYNHYFFIFKKK